VDKASDFRCFHISSGKDPPNGRTLDHGLVLVETCFGAVDVG
jgi:hypothetical protein